QIPATVVLFPEVRLIQDGGCGPVTFLRGGTGRDRDELPTGAENLGHAHVQARDLVNGVAVRQHRPDEVKRVLGLILADSSDLTEGRRVRDTYGLAIGVESV